jgi:hypothetical protein
MGGGGGYSDSESKEVIVYINDEKSYLHDPPTILLTHPLAPLTRQPTPQNQLLFCPLRFGHLEEWPKLVSGGGGYIRGYRTAAHHKKGERDVSGKVGGILTFK